MPASSTLSTDPLVLLLIEMNQGADISNQYDWAEDPERRLGPRDIFDLSEIEGFYRREISPTTNGSQSEGSGQISNTEASLQQGVSDLNVTSHSSPMEGVYSNEPYPTLDEGFNIPPHSLAAYDGDENAVIPIAYSASRPVIQKGDLNTAPCCAANCGGWHHDDLYPPVGIQQELEVGKPRFYPQDGAFNPPQFSSVAEAPYGTLPEIPQLNMESQSPPPQQLTPQARPNQTKQNSSQRPRAVAGSSNSDNIIARAPDRLCSHCNQLHPAVNYGRATRYHSVCRICRSRPGVLGDSKVFCMPCKKFKPCEEFTLIERTETYPRSCDKCRARDAVTKARRKQKLQKRRLAATTTTGEESFEL
ncbi:hypothetical protein RUND412_001083 [Rhizina undulata]